MESQDEIDTYDSLRDGIPVGMEVQFWEWVERQFTLHEDFGGFSARKEVINTNLAEHAAQVLSTPMASVRDDYYYKTMERLILAMKKVPNPLAVADFLLAHEKSCDTRGLEEMLQRSRSAWKVGERNGFRGLVRRVPEAVSVQLGHVARTAGAAGNKLMQAWEAIYGMNPNPTLAYTMAIRRS